MNNILQIAIGLVIPFLGTTLGAAMVFFMKKDMSPLVQKSLLGFASGVMIAASVWSLIIPSMQMSEDMGKWSFVPAAVGFMLGIGGVATFKKSALPDVLRSVVPLERIVLETDSPYLAPVPYRGRRNESAYVAATAKRIAEIYDVSEAVVHEITSQNALLTFIKAR